MIAMPLQAARTASMEENKMARVTGLEPATSGVTGRHSNRLSYTRAFAFYGGSIGIDRSISERRMARVTGLEPATSGVTGRHSNRLSYTRTFFKKFSSEEGNLLAGRPQSLGWRLSKRFGIGCQAGFKTKE